MTHPQYRQAGEQIPNVSFRVRDDGEWCDLTTEEIFSGRTVVVFALPGAFTPTCSKSHLPGFANHAVELKAAGIDATYCLSVNDWFVMDAWREALGVGDDVTMLPDGNGDFTVDMGLLVDKRDLGFGERSWRYAMIVRDGVIDSIFVEDFEDAGDPFEVSGAPQILAHLQNAAVAAE